MTTEERSNLMSRVRSKNTAPELITRKMLHSLGYRFRLHKKDLPGSPDIVLPRYRTVIFIHGCFWHGHSCSKGKIPSSNSQFWREKIESNIKRDKQREGSLESLGWKVITIWECEIKKSHELGMFLKSRLK